MRFKRSVNGYKRVLVSFHQEVKGRNTTVDVLGWTGFESDIARLDGIRARL